MHLHFSPLSKEENHSMFNILSVLDKMSNKEFEMFFNCSIKSNNYKKRLFYIKYFIKVFYPSRKILYKIFNDCLILFSFYFVFEVIKNIAE